MENEATFSREKIILYTTFDLMNPLLSLGRRPETIRTQIVPLILVLFLPPFHFQPGLIGRNDTQPAMATENEAAVPRQTGVLYMIFDLLSL